MKPSRSTIAVLLLCVMQWAWGGGKAARPTEAVFTAPAATADPDTPSIPPPSPTAAATSTASVPPVTNTPEGDQRVLSGDGRAELFIPPGALPAGVAPADTHITALDPANAGITTDDEPALGAYEFQSDGLVFTEPALLRLTLPLPPDGRLPRLLSLSGGAAETMTGLAYGQ